MTQATIMQITAELRKTYNKVIYMKTYNQFIIHHDGKEIRLKEDLIAALHNTGLLDTAHIPDLSTKHYYVQKILDMT